MLTLINIFLNILFSFVIVGIFGVVIAYVREGGSFGVLVAIVTGAILCICVIVKLHNRFKIKKLRNFTERGIRNMWVQQGAETFEHQDALAVDMIKQHCMQVLTTCPDKYLFTLRVYSGLSPDIIKNEYLYAKTLYDLIILGVIHKVFTMEVAKSVLTVEARKSFDS